MKLYFHFSVFDRHFLDVALQLKKQFPGLSFSGVANAHTSETENPVFHDVTYLSELDAAAEQLNRIDFNFLQRVEDRYNLLIADLIHAERHFARFSKSKRLAFLQLLIQCLLHSFENGRIDLIVSEGVDDISSLLLLRFSKYYHVPFVAARSGRLDEQIIFYDNETETPFHFNELFSQKDAAVMALGEKYITDYIANKKMPFYMKSGHLFLKKPNRADVRSFLVYIKKIWKDPMGFHYQWKWWQLPVNKLKRWTNLVKYNRLLSRSTKTSDHLSGCRYFVWPLHFHPEAATLVLGRRMNDQLALIEIISKNLPVDCKLVVKEHKVSIGRRNIEFYKKIDSFHNVVLVSHTTPVFPLLQGAAGVITISSTMGLEAIMMKKPVMVFGNPFYKISSNVYPGLNLEETASTIKAMLVHRWDAGDAHNLIGSFIKLTYPLGDLKDRNNRKAWDFITEYLIHHYIRKKHLPELVTEKH